RLSQQVPQSAKGLLLIAESHGPGMRGRAEDRDAKTHAGFGIAGSAASPNECRAPCQYARPGRVSAAASEFDDRASFACENAARRLRSNHGLKHERRKKVRFY